MTGAELLSKIPESLWDEPISGVDTVRDCAGHVDMSECARCFEVLTHLIQSLETT